MCLVPKLTCLTLTTSNLSRPKLPDAILSSSWLVIVYLCWLRRSEPFTLHLTLSDLSLPFLFSFIFSLTGVVMTDLCKKKSDSVSVSNFPGCLTQTSFTMHKHTQGLAEPHQTFYRHQTKCFSIDNCRSYDVLYVVDPSRLWYEGGDAATFKRLYYDRLQRYTSCYSHVVMVGDSMGASAALMCSPLATAVLAFCPQVRC